jgi:hypothetical protein
MSEVSEKMPDISDPQQVGYSPLEESLRRLEKLTRSLRIIGLMAFLLTIGCIGLSFFTAFSLSRALNTSSPSSFSSFSSLDRSTYRLAFSFSLVFGGMALAAVMFHESLRKQGDTLFEEISDELEWHVKDVSIYEKRDVAEERPTLRARIALRSFARTTDLPLIPGRFGPAIYAAINVLSILAEIWIARDII